MSVEDNIAEGKRLIDGSGASPEVQRRYSRGWRRWGPFCAESGVDPLDASWKDVVDCLDSEDMTKRWISELRSVLRLVYWARGMASPGDDRRVAVRAGIPVYLNEESYGEGARRWLKHCQGLYLGWCKHHGRDALRGGAAQVAEFLVTLTEDHKYRPGTVGRANTGVSMYLTARGCAATEYHPEVLRVLEECQESSVERKPERFSRAPTLRKSRSEYWRTDWETWLEGRDTRFEKATGADALDWLKGLEPQPRTYERVSALSSFYVGGYNPFSCNEVLQWRKEYRERVRSGEITKLVRVSRTEQVKAEWAEAKAQRALAELGIPRGLTSEEVGRASVDGGRRLAPSTVDGYAAAWWLLRDWLKSRDVLLEDVVDVHVRVYLETCASRMSVGSLQRELGGIDYGFRQHGFVVNPARSYLVSDYIYDLALERKESPAQVDPIREAEFQVILDRGFSPGRGPRSLKTELYWVIVVALVRVMYDGLLRGSEAVQAKWKHLSRMANGTGSLLIPYSKTDQEGLGVYTYVSAIAMEYLDRLRDVRRLLGIQERDSDPIFGGDVHQMGQLIIDICADAGLVGRYATHSMRIGAAQDLAVAGFGLSMIMQAGRWESPSQVKYYIRGITVAEGAMAELQRMLADGRHKVDVNARGYDVMSAFHAVKYGR